MNGWIICGIIWIITTGLCFLGKNYAATFNAACCVYFCFVLGYMENNINNS